VEREFEVINALFKSGFPVPRTYVLCEDNSVIGTPFYIMDFVRGRIFRDPNLPNMTPQERTAIYAELGRVLAQLHMIDYEKLGLGNYGKPGNYYERQIGVWTRQYQDSKTRYLYIYLA
jgi:aminoglycoside phosphotransferase (APT) family kinase protein